MTPEEEALLRVATAIIRRLRRLARKVDGISGTDVQNLRDSISIGGGGGGGSDDGSAPPADDPLVIVKIEPGSSYALGGCYEAHLMTRNDTAIDTSIAGTFNAATYFDEGE